MANPNYPPTTIVEATTLFTEDATIIHDVVNGSDTEEVEVDDGFKIPSIRKTLKGFEDEKEELFDQFSATFENRYIYARVDDWSAIVGQSVAEVDKLNSWLFTDPTSGEKGWYGPLQSQAFPITAPVNPAIDDGWALTDAATQHFALAASLNTAIDNVGYSNVGAEVKKFLRDDSQEKTYSVPSAAIGQTIVSVNHNVLEASGGTYHMHTVATENQIVDIEMFGAVDYNTVGFSNFDSTPAILAAYAYIASLGTGGQINISGQYKFTRLPTQSYTTLHANAGNAALICTDSTSEDEVGLGFGSAIRKPNDGTRNYMFNITGGLYIGTAISGVSAAEDLNPNVIGINITACERCYLDFRIGGFGYAGLVSARAGGGAEGLGYTSTTQDGNHNYIYCRSAGWCGKYGSGNAVIWLKFSANSNTIISFTKGADAAHFGMPFANNNNVIASTSENVKSVATFGSLAQDNTIWNPRCELATSDAFDFNDASTGNMVDGGRFTGVVGEFFKGLKGTTNVVRCPSAQVFYHGKRSYPPTTSVSQEYFFGVHEMTALGGNVNQPLYTVSEDYNDPASYPSHGVFSTATAIATGDIIGEHVCRNSDASGGAAGISGTIRYMCEGNIGQTAISFWTGTGTTLTEGWRQTSSQHWNPIVDSAFDIGSTASSRVRDLRIVNAPIVGSDYRIKETPESIPQQLLDFALSVEIKQYKLRGRERTHYGIIITTEFLDNLSSVTDLNMCAVFCQDVFTDEDGEPITQNINGVELGDLWQVRYDEWQNILLEAMRRKINSM